MIRNFDRSDKTIAYQAVLQAEMEHIERGTTGRQNPLQRVFIWIMVLIAVISFVWTVINTIPQEPSFLYWLLTALRFDMSNYYSRGGVNDILIPMTLLFPMCVLIWDFWLMYQTLVMSTNSITRERDGKNWDLLLLSGMNMPEIVKAKWRAVIDRQWRNYGLLAIMRMGAIAFFAMNFTVDFSFGQSPAFSYGRVGPVAEPQSTTIYLLAVGIVLLSAALIALLTLLNLMFTAACGIVGGIIAQRTSLSLPSGIGVRILLVIAIAIVTVFPAYLVLKTDIETFFYYPDPVVNTLFLIFGLMGVTMVDNGVVAAGLLMRYGYNFRWNSDFHGFVLFLDTLRGHGPAFLIGLLLSSILYAALTYILLWRVAKIITRQSFD